MQLVTKHTDNRNESKVVFQAIAAITLCFVGIVWGLMLVFQLTTVKGQNMDVKSRQKMTMVEEWAFNFGTHNERQEGTRALSDTGGLLDVAINISDSLAAMPILIDRMIEEHFCEHIQNGFRVNAEIICQAGAKIIDCLIEELECVQGGKYPGRVVKTVTGKHDESPNIEDNEPGADNSRTNKANLGKALGSMLSPDNQKVFAEFLAGGPGDIEIIDKYFKLKQVEDEIAA